MPTYSQQQNNLDALIFESKESRQDTNLISRNITICGRRTSVRLEPEMWTGFYEICRREHQSLHNIATAVAERKAESASFTASLRVFIMSYFRAASTEDGHVKAGHGPGGAFMAEIIHAIKMKRLLQ